MTYFAYGTLLDIETMKATAPSAKPLGVMRLDGYQMSFAQCADGKSTGCHLEVAPGKATYGVLYDLDEADMARMDKGAISGDQLWLHLPVKLTAEDGTVFESKTYIIGGAAPRIVPTEAYVKPILKGLASLPFPEGYVETMEKIIRS